MLLNVTPELTEARDYLGAVLARLDDPREALTILGGLLEDYQREVFATRDHGRWRPLDPATIALKGSSRVLVDTGGLLENLTDAQVERDSVVVNAGDAKHAEHLRKGARGMPKRDPSPVPSARVVTDWADQVLGYLAEGRR